MLDLFNNCCSFVMCDQKTAEGFSFHSILQIYRQQKQGDKHTGSSKPLLASRSPRLLALNTKAQQLSAAGMFRSNSAAGAQKCPWPLLVKARPSVFPVKADEPSSFWGLDLSLTGATSAEQQTIHNIDNHMSLMFQPSSRVPTAAGLGKMHSIFEVAVEVARQFSPSIIICWHKD